MHCTFEKSAIAHTVQQAARIAKSNSPAPILACLCLQASPTGIQLIATDLEVALVSQIAGTCEAAGSVVVPANRLAAIIAELDF